MCRLRATYSTRPAWSDGQRLPEKEKAFNLRPRDGKLLKSPSQAAGGGTQASKENSGKTLSPKEP